MIKILYAEDDVSFASKIVNVLSSAGYQVFHAIDGSAALSLYKKEKPDLVLLDVLMPGKTGFEVARVIREKNPLVPILFVSSLTNSQHAIEGYRIGGNDYIRKEVMFEEIVCRVESFLTRRNFSQPEVNYIRMANNVSLDAVSRILIVDGVESHLSPTETKIMKLLFMNKNQYVDKKSLVMEGWGNDFKESFRYLDKVLVRLRKVIHDDCSVEIATSWGKGYGLMEKKRTTNV